MDASRSDRLSDEDLAKIAQVQQKVDEAQSLLAELMGGWNHGAKLMASTSSLYSHLDQAKQSAQSIA